MLGNKDIMKFLDKMIVTDRASVMMICIEGSRDNEPYGIIVNIYLKDPVPFKGLEQLILTLDEICEIVGSPSYTMNPRFFRESMGQRYRELSRKGELAAMKNARVDLDRFLRLAIQSREVLFIQILYRGNATMQGRVRCSLTYRNYISFRSALELMRMLREAGPLLWNCDKRE